MWAVRAVQPVVAAVNDGSAFQRPIQRLLCMPANTRLQTPAAAGTEPVVADCGHSVWVAPSGRQMWETKQILLLCLPCGVRSRPPEEPLFVSRAQFEELVAIVGLEEAWVRLGRLGITEVKDPD